MGASVTMGNVSPIAKITVDAETGAKQLHRWHGLNATETGMYLVEDDLFGQMRDAITLWGESSDQPPAWIESDDEALAAALRKHFGDVGGRPEDWEQSIDEVVTLVPVEPEPVAEDPAAVPSDPEPEVQA